MDFRDQIKQLTKRILASKEQVLTEEATKNAFIMPMLQILGYDVFNPLEIVPEFTAGRGMKKGEKIDYAILYEEKPLVLIECKHWKQNLNLHEGQLFRYVQSVDAKLGVLTNGIQYRFYTDTIRQNIMDEMPFLEFDITKMTENEIEELMKFHRSNFNIENICHTAKKLKYITEIETIIRKEIITSEPSERFVEWITQQIYNGNNITAKIIEQFTLLTQKICGKIEIDLADAEYCADENVSLPTAEEVFLEIEDLLEELVHTASKTQASTVSRLCFVLCDFFSDLQKVSELADSAVCRKNGVTFDQTDTQQKIDDAELCLVIGELANKTGKRLADPLLVLIEQLQIRNTISGLEPILRLLKDRIADKE